jgi:predicted RNase H-like nuclease
MASREFWNNEFARHQREQITLYTPDQLLNSKRDMALRARASYLKSMYARRQASIDTITDALKSAGASEEDIAGALEDIKEDRPIDKRALKRKAA